MKRVAVSVLKTKNHSSKASFPLSINLSLYFFSGDAQLYYNPHFTVQPISLSLDRKENRCSFWMPCVLLIFLNPLFFLKNLYVSRKWENCGEKTVNVPLFGETSIFSLVVFLFCLAFAVFWASTRHASYSWIGQDILVSFIFYYLHDGSFCYHRNV
jgi:hypothetical protein